MNFLIMQNTNSNITFYAIILILLVMSLIMFYLVYAQNKELKEQMNRKIVKSLKDTQEVPIVKEEPKSTQSEIEELQALTKELAIIPREKRIEMTPYEEEQEQRAIISYDELLKRGNNQNISYSNEEKIDDITIKNVDIENTNKINLNQINQEVNKFSYEHEEAFLNNLKNLQKTLD